MKNLTLLISIAILSTSCSENPCRLNDGRYKVIYDQDYSTFEYEVKFDTIKQIYQDASVSSVITWISENEYYLNDLPAVLEQKDELNTKLLTLGKPFYRLGNCSNDTIDFKLMRNQHITLNSGKIIRLD